MKGAVPMGSRWAGWLGGSPLGVIAKLVFLSLVVGAIMAGLGLSPGALIRNAVAAAQHVFGLGLDTFQDVGRYVLTGAVIVVPIWLATRLLATRR